MKPGNARDAISVADASLAAHSFSPKPKSTSTSDDDAAPWGWIRQTLIMVALLAATLPAIRLARHPQGDFLNHYKFGQRFVLHELLYANGLDYPYPPAWAMVHAPLYLMSPEQAQLFLYPLGVIALVFLYRATIRMTRVGPQQGYHDDWFWPIVCATVVTSRFISRDFLECGPNIVLLTLCWLSFVFWRKGNSTFAGILLAIPCALKCTSLIFVGYFLIKRQYRMVASSLVATLAISVAPVLWMGPADYQRHMTEWGETLVRGATESDPSIGILGPQPLANKSLRPALARFFMSLPAGHPGRVDHISQIDFLNLAPKDAGRLISVIMMSLGMAVVWGFRKPVTNRRDPRISWDLALVSVVMLLFSPITWGHHCVATIPLFILLFREVLTRPSDRPILSTTVFLLGLVLVVGNRDIVGKDASFFLEGYRLVTLLLVLLLPVGLWAKRPIRSVSKAEIRAAVPRAA